MSTANKNRIAEDLSQEGGPSEWQRQLSDCQHATADAIRENPLAATLAVFGVGFCVGTAIGAMFGETDFRRRENLANSLGRRLMQSINDYTPDVLQQHLRS